MKFLKWIGILFVLLLVLIVGAAIVLPLVIDPNDHKDRMVTLVKEQTGRDFAIDGELGWSVFPFVGVSVNDLTLGNADGFSAPHMAKIASADVAVKLMPLLSKKVEMNGITLNGLDLNLETNAAGTTNWHDLVAAGEADPDVETPAGGSPIDQLQIGFFELSDSRLNWSDQQAGQTFAIDQINVKSGAITDSAPIDVDYSLHIASPELKLDATVGGEAQVRNALADAPIAASISDLTIDGGMDTISFEVRGDQIDADLGSELVKLAGLSIDGEMKSETRPLSFALKGENVEANLGSQLVKLAGFGVNGRLPDGLPYDVQLGAGEVNLTADTAAFPNVTVKAGPANVQVNLTAAGLTTNPAVNGSLNVAAFNPREVFKLLSIEAPETADASSISSLAVSGDFRYAGDAASLKNLQARLDDTNITGDFDLSSIERLAGNFVINVDSIDLDRYLPPPSEEESSEASGSITPPDVDFGNLNGTIHIDQLLAKGVTTNDINLRLKTTPNGVEVGSIDSKLYEGAFAGKLKFDKSGQVELAHSINGLQAQPLMQALTGKDLLGGIAKVSHDLKVGNVFAENPLSTLNGSVTYNFNEGTLYGVDVGQLAQQAASKLGYAAAATGNQSGFTKFSDLAVTATVTDGVLSTNDFDLKAGFMDAGGGGSINLAEQTLDYRLDVTLHQIPAELADRGLDKLVGQTIPIRLTGSLFAPTPMIDVEYMVKAAAGRKLDEKKDELKDKLVGKLFGDEGKASDGSADGGEADAEPSTEDQLKDKLLGGLLGGSDKSAPETTPEGEAKADPEPEPKAEEQDPEDALKQGLRGILGRKLGGSKDQDEDSDGDGGGG